MAPNREMTARRRVAKHVEVRARAAPRCRPREGRAKAQWQWRSRPNRDEKWRHLVHKVVRIRRERDAHRGAASRVRGWRGTTGGDRHTARPNESARARAARRVRWGDAGGLCAAQAAVRVVGVEAHPSKDAERGALPSPSTSAAKPRSASRTGQSRRRAVLLAARPPVGHTALSCGCT